jgi:ATP-binding cassette subfamily B protein
VSSTREFSVPDAPAFDRRSPVRWVLSHLLRYPHLLVGFGGMVLLTSVAAAMLPRLTGLAFDVVSGARTDLSLAWIALAMVGVAVVQGVSGLARGVLVEMAGQRVERDAREELYIVLLGKSQTFHNRQRVGDIMARASNDVRQLNPMMNPGVSLITQSALGLIVPIAMIATIHVQLLLAPLLFTAAFLWAVRRYMRQLGPVTGALRAQFGRMNAALTETVTGIEVVKSTATETSELERFVTNARGYRDRFVEQGAIQARYLPMLLVGLAIALAFAHGLYLYAVDVISLGDLVATMGLMGALRFPAFISVFTFLLVQLGLAGAARILQLMEEEAGIDENARGHGADVSGTVRFEDVRFSYGGVEGKEVLKGLTFEVPAGATIALVGQTGSGKSTLTKLLNRTYDPTAGRVLVDGVDVKDWDLQSLRPQISVIEQDIFLFSRSIAENIGFGLGDAASDAAIEDAARAAQAHGFITELPEGYATVIGENGVTLSGGQRQRLAIARALLTDPRILVLDDATSAIDSATEDQIQLAIAAVLEGRTTFLITHRLSQIRRADHILVLHAGEVVDQGPHAALLERCALYRRMFARQGEVAWPS